MSEHRRKAQIAEPRMTDLIGCTEDGRMIFWDRGMVQAVSKFETFRDVGRTWIVTGHYVIHWHGHAITVHCGNLTDGSVGVQFMCAGGYKLSLRRRQVEAMLLGKVIPDPEHQALLRALLAEAREALHHASLQPHRQRGQI